MNYDHLAESIEDESTAPASIRDLAEEMRELKERLDSLEAKRKAIQARYDAIRLRELVDAMSVAGVTNFKMPGVGTFYISKKVQAGVREENRVAFFQWLRDNGHAGLIQPQVHPSTLTSWAREQLEAGVVLPDLIAIYSEPLVAMRKS